MATHSSILAWDIPRTEKPDRLQSMSSQRAGHSLSDLACTLPTEGRRRKENQGRGREKKNLKKGKKERKKEREGMGFLMGNLVKTTWGSFTPF